MLLTLLKRLGRFFRRPSKSTSTAIKSPERLLLGGSITRGR